MLMYFLSVIETRISWLESVGNLTSDQIAVLKEIEERRSDLEQNKDNLSEDAAWIEAYGLERLLALLEPPQNLIPEIRLRLDEAASERVSAEPRLRAAFQITELNAFDSAQSPPALRPNEIPSLRAFLLEILEELHWTFQRKFLARPLQKSATRRIVGAGLISFVFFTFPYFYIYIRAYSGPTIEVELLPGLPLYTALTAGVFGAFFSRLLFVQANAVQMSVGELKTARELTSIFLRGSVGMCGALVVFFFLRSGIVSGNLFPVFDELSLREGTVSLFDKSKDATVTAVRSILPSPSLALLAIWCFLAGFSERLVPSILSTTEQTLGDASKGGKK